MSVNLQKALVVSLTVHLILLAIFFFIPVHPAVTVPAEVEISFAGQLPTQTAAALPKRPKSVLPRPPVEKKNVATPKTKSVVALPKRRMAEEEEPLLPVRPEEKVSPEEQPLTPPPEKSPQSPTSGIPGLPQTAPIQGEKGILPPPTGQTGEEKEIPSVTQEPGKGEKHPFKIEGEASRREILSKVLPSYPKGYHGEGVVKLKFTVLPSGLVGDVLPLVKADPVLEKITIDAFQQWRFNPIPPDKPQKTATGVITFRYVLK